MLQRGNEKKGFEWGRGDKSPKSDDHRMPGRDGRQIAVEMKDWAPAVPIVMITGYGEVKIAVKTHQIASPAAR